jgi:hypothetical protein
MKLAHVVNADSPRDKLMQLYGQNLAKRTNGRIKAQVYPRPARGQPTGYPGGPARDHRAHDRAYGVPQRRIDLPFLFPNIMSPRA